MAEKKEVSRGPFSIWQLRVYDLPEAEGTHKINGINAHQEKGGARTVFFVGASTLAEANSLLLAAVPQNPHHWGPCDHTVPLPTWGKEHLCALD